MRRLRRLTLFFGLLLVSAVVLGAVFIAREQPDVTLTVDDARPTAVSRLELGVTHDQHSLDPWGDPSAVSRGRALLETFARYENQHIYGWGALNPNPAPGVYDWRSLDRRIKGIEAAGGTPVITLCCAPDWMTALGTNTSRYPNVPPTRAHVGDFADLAARVARRYPGVRHFIVWNEMKGLWNPEEDTWDYRRYTAIYNRIYDAVKAARPDARIGGPYLILEGTGSTTLGAPETKTTAAPITSRDTQVLDFWLEHKRGADFIAVDRSLVVQSRDTNDYDRDDLLLLTRWFADVTRQIRARTDLPVWFAEDYVVDGEEPRFVAAQLGSMLLHEMIGGVAVSLRWGPQQEAEGDAGAGNSQAIFSDTRDPAGGRPTLNYAVYKAFADHFPPGTKVFPVETSAGADELVEAVASKHAVLVINRTPRALRVRLGAGTFELPPYGVRARERVSGSEAAQAREPWRRSCPPGTPGSTGSTAAAAGCR
jgi:hypothetical protein